MPQAPSAPSSDGHGPIDPLTPRADDPWLCRGWWARRLYRRSNGKRAFLRGPVALTLMMLALSLVALGVYLLARA